MRASPWHKSLILSLSKGEARRRTKGGPAVQDRNIAREREMQQNVAATIIKLLVLSLIVGLALNLFDLDPLSLLANFGGTVEAIFKTLVSAISWAIPHVLLGAAVVVPIWLALLLLRAARKR